MPIFNSFHDFDLPVSRAPAGGADVVTAVCTVNKALGVVKVIYREAFYRNPTAGVGKVNYRKEEREVSTAEELRRQHTDFDRQAVPARG